MLQWSGNIGMLRVRGDHSSVRGLVLKNTSGALPANENQGYGIAIGRRSIADAHPHPGTSTDTEYVKGGHKPLRPALIEDVTIQNARGWAIYIPGYGLQSDEVTPEPDRVVPTSIEGGTLSFWLDLKRVRTQTSGKFGLLFIGAGCTTTFFEDCALLHQGYLEAPSVSYYAYLAQCVQPVFERCTFEGLSQQTREWVRLYGTANPTFDCCWFENDPPPSLTTPTYFLRFAHGCRGGSVRHCQFVRADKCNGYLRLIQIDPGGGATGLTILSPSGVSVNSSFDVQSGNYVDPAHIDLGDDDNTELAVLGNGSYFDFVRGLVLPFQVVGAPQRSALTGSFLHRVPRFTDSDLTSKSPSRDLAKQDGNLLLNRDLPDNGSGIGALMYYFGAWRLANNAPTLSTAERDSRANWVQGDTIYNPTTGTLQVLIGGVWKNITLT